MEIADLLTGPDAVLASVKASGKKALLAELAARCAAMLKLDERRWAYGITAPFDMAPHIPDLMETKVSLDGKLFKIRGIVPGAPFVPIKAGEFVEILVVTL